MKNDTMYRYDTNFYRIMAENFGGEIFVTDGEGRVLFVNPEAANVIGRPIHEIVGRHVVELEEEGFFKPSVTMEVIKHRTQIDIIQTVKDGKKVLCTGTPVFDEESGNLRMVISTTRDVKAFSQIYEKMERQSEELSNLRDIFFEESGFVSGNSNNSIKEKLIKLASLDVPVLLTGETGVGKGVAAKIIHSAGKGREKAMIKINCGIIPENLIESELFGYEPGAFTGAVKGGKKGKVEMAEGGTLFLDEIGEMPLAVQVKLLDFIQYGTFTRVGGTEEHKVNTRIIAATNRNLEKMCREGSFRQDLYYRINVMPFEIPPLRERPEDLDALIKHFISRCNQKYGGKKELGRKAAEAMSTHPWPGNIRQLENTIERLYILAEEDVITERDFNDTMIDSEDPANDEVKLKCSGLMPLRDAKWELERQLVSQAYRKYGSTYKAANALKVDQSTVVKLLKKHDIK